MVKISQSQERIYMSMFKPSVTKKWLQISKNKSKHSSQDSMKSYHRVLLVFLSGRSLNSYFVDSPILTVIFY